MFFREAAQQQLQSSHLDEFRIGHTLGQGGYAIVKLATHLSTQRRVALKIYSNLSSLKAKAV